MPLQEKNESNDLDTQTNYDDIAHHRHQLLCINDLCVYPIINVIKTYFQKYKVL